MLPSHQDIGSGLVADAEDGGLRRDWSDGGFSRRGDVIRPKRCHDGQVAGCSSGEDYDWQHWSSRNTMGTRTEGARHCVVVEGVKE